MSGSPYRWRAIGKSVIGAAHGRSGLPNQDRLHVPKIGAGAPLILALADGHGSAKSFRSHRGAWLAVKTAQEVARPLFAMEQSPTGLKRWAENDLPRALVQRWQELVDGDIASDPFSGAEQQILSLLDPGNPRRLLAYGSTLLTVVVTDAFIFYLQLGDGDILVVSDSGQVDRPLPPDERLIANETTSLCQEQAWREARTRFQVISESPPALILASTDGYANSFRDEDSFLRVGSDLLQLIRCEGLDVVEQNLESWLAEASRVGSGDDVTLGMLYRTASSGSLQDHEQPAPPDPG